MMRRMILADLYSYRTHGWHQYGWPILPMEWYETLFALLHGGTSAMMRRMILGDLYSGVVYIRVQRCISCPLDYNRYDADCDAPYCYGLPHNVPTEWIATV